MTTNELTLVAILLGVTLFLAALVVLQTVRLGKARNALLRARYEAEERAYAAELAAMPTKADLAAMPVDAFRRYFEHSHIARWDDMETIHAWLEAQRARKVTL